MLTEGLRADVRVDGGGRFETASKSVSDAATAFAFSTTGFDALLLLVAIARVDAFAGFAALPFYLSEKGVEWRDRRVEYCIDINYQMVRLTAA